MKRYTRAYVRADDSAESGPLHFVVSTETLGRDGLIIDADGWELDNYRLNPVVLWVHDYMGRVALPIGRAEVEQRDSELHADITFDPDDPFAQAIERKYRARYLNAVSVGWDTKEIKIVPSEVNEPNHITKAELLDVSAVPVPGDPNALIERQLAGLRALGYEIALPVPADREGAVLSARNREDLEKARDLLAAVLKRASKDDDPDRGLDPEAVKFLETISSRLEAVGSAKE